MSGFEWGQREESAIEGEEREIMRGREGGVVDKQCTLYYYYSQQSVINPVENGSNLIEENISQLKIIMNKVRKDKLNTNPLTMKLNGTLDAAVNGGVSNFDVSQFVIIAKYIHFITDQLWLQYFITKCIHSSLTTSY